ncbi:MAG: DEAD/DEAH box helicase [Thermoplasmata archaeon]|nr:DEAD/DEAH box helicase [Thermoplasmata archaeon]
MKSKEQVISHVTKNNPQYFHQFKLNDNILKALDGMNFRTPTEVQRKVIPLALDHLDVMVQSQTGTGKTAAFGLPILKRLRPDDNRTQALILAPTRELAIQIAKEIKCYGKFTRAHIVPVYGGQKIQTQISLLRKGAHVVVSTPGRLIDHLGRNTISLNHVDTVVLDEADRMLDMGFIEDIMRILRHTPRTRQTMLFTATLLREVQILARDFMHKPIKVLLSSDRLVVPSIDETFYQVGRRNKLWALMQVVTLEDPHQAIIFCETKRMVDIVAERLHKLRIKASALHGDFRQSKRERIMSRFRKGDIRFLVATDVAARGLDILAVSHVFNYDVPENKEQYVHRVGRTGRIGMKGRAITLVSKEDFHSIAEIERFLDRKIQLEMVPENITGRGKDKESKTRNPLRKVLDFNDMADTFGMIRLRLDAGEEQGVTNFELVEFLSSDNPMWDINIGMIEVSENETLIEIKKHVISQAMKRFQREKYKGLRLHYDFIQNIRKEDA